MGAMSSQMTSLAIVYSIIHSGADQRKHQSSASLAFVCGEFTGGRWIPRTKASDAENASVSWRHHVVTVRGTSMLGKTWGQSLPARGPKHSLTHWGRVTHICVRKLAIICSDNGLSAGRCQAIIWTNAGILSIGPWEQSSILIKIHIFSFTETHLKMSAAKARPCVIPGPQCVKKRYVCI